MQLSLNWLQEFLDLKDQNPQELAKILTERVAEVENLQTETELPASVVIGQIQEIQNIPQADKIRLTKINTGKEILSIICGAPNICVGAKVPVALIGTVLPNKLKIAPRKIRGVDSQGMLCSESELGRSPESRGIWLLPTEFAIGTPLKNYFPPDTIFTIDNHALTHRPDLFAIRGFARELATLLKRPFQLPAPTKIPTTPKLSIENQAPQFCFRYVGLKIENLQVRESPPKIKNYLQNCGIRAVNNLVDATNYVLLELGQPLHAFDAEQIQDEKIIIRGAQEKEKIETLDQQIIELQKDDLIIADPTKPLALAGIMGGAHSEITENSTTIILESANFAASKIRKLSQRLGLRSESSLRFEKGLDPNLPPIAAARAIEILRLTCPELRVTASNDLQNFEPVENKITLNLDQVTKKLQIQIPPAEINATLTQLGLQIKEKDSTTSEIITPSWRPDLQAEIDLIEELGRLFGYSRIPTELPRLQIPALTAPPTSHLIRQTQDLFVGLNFQETLTLPLVAEKLLNQALIQFEAAIKIQNPPSLAHEFLRNSLVPGLLKVAQTNCKKLATIRIFEISKIFTPPETETQMLTAVIREKTAFRKILGVLTTYFKKLKISSLEIQPLTNPPPQLHPGRAATILIQNQKIGIFGQIHPQVLNNFELSESAYLDLNFTQLSEIWAKRPSLRSTPPPKFPGVIRDLAFYCAPTILAAAVKQSILTADPQIQKVELFDEFLEPQNQRKNLAFHVEFRSTTKTLTEAEEEAIVQKILQAVGKIGGSLREAESLEN